MFWRTNNNLRMRLMGDNFAGNINGYPGLNLSGFFGLDQFVHPRPVQGVARARLHCSHGP